MRVEHALSNFVLSHRPDVILVVYDKRIGAFRALNFQFARLVTGWTGKIDLETDEAVENRQGLRRLVPSRSAALLALERHRLLTQSSLVSGAIDRVQRLAYSVGAIRFPYADQKGRRFSVVPWDLALGNPIELGAGDVLLSPSSDWWHKDISAITVAKVDRKFRLTVMCYDLLPIIQPHFFPSADCEIFLRYWTRMFTIADVVIVNADCIRQDCLHFCESRRITPPDVAVVPLGSDFTPRTSNVPGPPSGLSSRRYALFVSTVEPRKNHRILISAWRHLLARGVPQRHNFSLVFVGRSGWMVDDVLKSFQDPSLAGTVRHLSEVDDDALAGLYAHAAFCLYPSRYEGFGLPLIEAFAHGRAVVASTGGALPEVMAGLGPTLDPDDEMAWASAIENWIEHPEQVRATETLIASRFRPISWTEVGQRIFAIAENGQPRGRPAEPIAAVYPLG